MCSPIHTQGRGSPTFRGENPTRSNTMPDNNSKTLLDCWSKAGHSKWRFFGTPAQLESFLTSESPRSRHARCMEAKILLVKSTDPVADGRRTEPREHTHDTKSQPTNKLLQRVLNKSLVHHTMFKFSTVEKCQAQVFTGVTCERSISANLFISLERTPCPVPQSCTAGSDDKKIQLQKHAHGVHNVAEEHIRHQRRKTEPF